MNTETQRHRGEEHREIQNKKSSLCFFPLCLCASVFISTELQ